MLWSLLAGILLKVEDRYIGISITALTIALAGTFITDRKKKATSIKRSIVERGNIEFYKQSLGKSLIMKKKWKVSEENAQEEVKTEGQ